MACSANVTDSSGVAGNRMLPSAIRNVLIRYPNLIACAIPHAVEMAHPGGDSNARDRSDRSEIRHGHTGQIFEFTVLGQYLNISTAGAPSE